MIPSSSLPRLLLGGSLLLVSCPAVCFSQAASSPQQPPPQPPKAQQSGIAGGLGAPAQYDEQRRPITAGGFVKPGQAPVVFEDITKKAGLSGWIHKMGSPKKDFIVETNGSGVCLIDYNNDGWLDIYLVNGATFDSLDGKEPPPHAALFRNNHDGTFTDVSKEAGVENDRWGYGCSVADYDNDGWPDLYVGNYGPSRLYHNNHNGTFSDVAPKLGLALDNWHPGSAWGDYDGDGRLDLYVTGYVHFDRNNLPVAGTKAVGYAQCLYRGSNVNCGPRGLQGEPDHLFHQKPDGTFEDVTVKAGVEDKDRYYGFATIFIDVNNDGKPDLVVGNDSEPNFLYINKGDGTFDDQSYVSGLALNKDGREIASMGIAAGDYENNGLVDFFFTDFGDDYKVLYHNDGDASFTDVSYKSGLAQPTIPFVGWGDGFLDYDNDGWLDLFEVNGHVYPEVDQHDWGTSWAERPLLFHNVPDANGKDRKFESIKPVEGTGLADVIPARGAAFGDLFNDGKIDVIINPIDGPAVLLKNVNPDHHHWVEMSLIGGSNPKTGKKSPKDATCATVYLKANIIRGPQGQVQVPGVVGTRGPQGQVQVPGVVGTRGPQGQVQVPGVVGMRQRRDVLASGSYISANDRRPHFGLGDATDPGTAEIHWPSGQVETIKLPAADRIYTIEEGVGITAAMCEGKPCPDFKPVKPETTPTPAHR